MRRRQVRQTGIPAGKTSQSCMASGGVPAAWHRCAGVPTGVRGGAWCKRRCAWRAHVFVWHGHARGLRVSPMQLTLRITAPRAGHVPIATGRRRHRVLPRGCLPRCICVQRLHADAGVVLMRTHRSSQQRADDAINSGRTRFLHHPAYECPTRSRCRHATGPAAYRDVLPAPGPGWDRCPAAGRRRSTAASTRRATGRA